MNYEFTWRNKWLTANAISIDQMIDAHEMAIKELREIQEDGLEADFDNASDDYITFRTSNPVLAEKYSMNEMDWLDEGDLIKADDDFEESTPE